MLKRSIKRLVASLSLAIALVGLAACETVSVSPEQLQLINGGTQSGIIMSYKEHEGFWGSTIRFANVVTGQTYSVSMHGGDNWVNAGPDMVMAPPGTYRVAGGSVYSSDATGTMPLLQWWFKEFTLAAGEVVDIGTLKMTDIDVRSITSDQLAQFFNALGSFGDTREVSTYVMYEVDYSDDARVQAMLKSKYPTLTVTPVKRPLQVALDRKEFERLIVEAYSPGPDGKSPTSEAATAKVNALVREFVARSLIGDTPGTPVEVPVSAPKNSSE